MPRYVYVMWTAFLSEYVYSHLCTCVNVHMYMCIQCSYYTCTTSYNNTFRRVWVLSSLSLRPPSLPHSSFFAPSLSSLSSLSLCPPSLPPPSLLVPPSPQILPLPTSHPSLPPLDPLAPLPLPLPLSSLPSQVPSHRQLWISGGLCGKREWAQSPW